MYIHSSAHSTGGDRSDHMRFSELYRRWYPVLVKRCRRYLGPHGDPEAIAQEAFIRAWASWGDFSADRPFGPWLWTIARRLCLNEIRNDTRRRLRLATVVEPERSSSDAFDQAVQGDEIMAALSDLPAREQRLLLLRDAEGWSYAAIARFEGVSLEAVRGALKRARQAFRRRYDELSGGAAAALGAARRALGAFGPRRASCTRGAEHAGWVLARSTGWEPALAVIAGLVLAVPTAVPGVGSGGSLTGTVEAREGAEPTALSATAAPSSTDRPRSTASATGRGSTDAAAPAVGPDDASALTPTAGWDYEFTPSPSYEHDRTVFAAGIGAGTSPTRAPMLFKSEDGGSTWAHLPARGRDVGRIMLPPAYPRDARIFSVSSSMLSVSEDGGATFRPVTAVTGEGAMSPQFSDGDPRIVFGVPYDDVAGVPVQYRDDDRSVAPMQLPLPMGATPVRFAFSPEEGGDGDVMVAVRELGPPDRSGSQLTLVRKTAKLYRCDRHACEPLLDLGNGVAVPRVIWTKAPASALAAWTPFALYRSFDGGRSMARVPLPVDDGPDDGAMIESVTVAPSGGLLVVMVDDQSQRLYSLDGTAWTFIGEGRSPFRRLAALPDGRWLAGRAPDGGEGIFCSLDQGASWTRSCPR